MGSCVEPCYPLPSFSHLNDPLKIPLVEIRNLSSPRGEGFAVA
jgi:hypothetical protein